MQADDVLETPYVSVDVFLLRNTAQLHKSIAPRHDEAPAQAHARAMTNYKLPSSTGTK